MNLIKRKKRAGVKPTPELIPNNRTAYSVLSSRTKDFIQKFCYKKGASVDMTKYGFMSESKTRPVNLLIKPLRLQIEKICGSANNSRKGSPPRSREKGAKKPGSQKLTSVVKRNKQKKKEETEKKAKITKQFQDRKKLHEKYKRQSLKK